MAEKEIRQFTPEIAVPVGADKLLMQRTSDNATRFAQITNIVGAIAPPAEFAEISVNANGVGTVATVIGVPVQVLIFNTDGISNGATPDHTNDHITIGKTGNYLVLVSGNHLPNTAADTWTFEVFINNGVTGFLNLITTSTQPTVFGHFSFSISGLAAFTAGDTVEVWATQFITVPATTIVESINLSILQIP